MIHKYYSFKRINTASNLWKIYSIVHLSSMGTNETNTIAYLTIILLFRYSRHVHNQNPFMIMPNALNLLRN